MSSDEELSPKAVAKPQEIVPKKKTAGRPRQDPIDVGDTVATDALVMRAGHTYVPVGGIADAGARGISKVEVQVDEGPWEAAQLRPPLSGLTWVIWRYEWPFQSGEHAFKVRAYDGKGVLQTSASNPPYPAGATGIDSKQASVLPKAP